MWALRRIVAADRLGRSYSTYWRRYERRLIIDALLLCTRSDMPAAVDEMVRARMLSRDGADALTTAAAVREFAAILATWVEQGCP